MFDALYIGATGMQAQQLNVDTIANNLANVNTTGFKKARVSFSDLMVRDFSRIASGQLGSDSGLLSPVMQLGAGVGIASLSKIFDMGDMKKTDSPFDVSVQGQGFIEVTMPDGSRAYTRGGSLKVNPDGQLATLAGNTIEPAITMPDNAQALIINPNGDVQARVTGQSTPVDIGRIELFRFASPEGLIAQGDNLYRASDISGEAIATKSGDTGTGILMQGYLEGANVKLVDEMVNLTIAQRTYEANVKVVQAADEMMGMVNGLRK